MTNESIMGYTFLFLIGFIVCVMIWSMWLDIKNGYVPRKRDNSNDSSFDVIDIAVISGIASSCD